MDLNNLWSDIDLKTQKQNSRCLAVNTILAGKYLVGPVLGQGGFGITYLGYDLNMETRIAIKEYFPVELVSRDTTTMHGDRVLSLSGEKSITYQQGLKKYVAEAQNVSQFADVPGVVSVKDFFYENDTAYIVMEYIDGISLKDYLKEKGGRLSEAETLAIMKPVIEALEKVHSAGIIHRDISPDNIMLTFEEPVGASGGQSVPAPRTIKSVKLIDFGAARMAAKNDQKSLTIILKHGYAPEEQYRTHGEQGPWTDVYAVCAVMYRMLTGQTPVPAMDRMFKDELKNFEELGFTVSAGENSGQAQQNTAISAGTAAALLKGLAVKKDARIQSMRELIGALYENQKIAGDSAGKKKILWAAVIGAGALLLAGIVLGIVLSIGRYNDSAVNGTDATDGQQISEEENTGEENIDGFNTEELENRLVWTTSEVLLAGGDDYVISLREDGTVLVAGSNEQGQCEISDWYDIAAVYTSRTASAGITKEGRVVIAGNEELNEAVSSWYGIVQLAVDSNYVLGLTEVGKVVSAGYNGNGSCNTGDWENIVSIWSAAGISFGITEEGNLLIAGTDDFYEEELALMQEWTNLKQVGFAVGDGHFYGLKKDGTILYTGENLQETFSSWSQITYLVNAGYGVAGLKEDGTVVATHKGMEKSAGEWQEVISVAGTLDYLVALQKDGTIKVTGGSSSNQELKGLYAIEEVLSMTDLKQAVWVDDYLMVLRQDGSIIASAAQNHETDEIAIPQWNEAVVALVPDDKGVIGLTEDGRVLREERHYVSVSVSSSEMTAEEASERRNKTPRLYDSWKNVVQASGDGSYLAALLADGTVNIAGFPEHQPDTDYRTGLPDNSTANAGSWTGIRQLLAMRQNVIGLKEEGTLIWTSEESWYQYLGNYEGLKSIWGNSLGYCDYLAAIREDGTVEPINLPEENGMSNLTGWTDMVKLAMGDSHLAGLKEDGTVLAAGSNFAGKCDVEEWTDVVDLTVCDTATVGITTDGRLLMAGAFPEDLYAAEKWPAVSVESLLYRPALGAAGNGQSGGNAQNGGNGQSGAGNSQSAGQTGSGMVTMNMDGAGDTLGEQIVFYEPQDSMAQNRWYTHTLICKADGTVEARGENSYGQCNVQDWDHVVAVGVGMDHSIGLRTDGTVYAAGANEMGQCDVSHWRDIVKISADGFLSLGITEDGTVMVAGNADGNAADVDLNVVGSWTDMKEILFDYFHGIVFGLKTDGTVLVEGSLDYAGTIKDWQNVEHLIYADYYLIGLETDGTLHAEVMDPDGVQSAGLGNNNLETYRQLPKMRQFDGRNGVGISMEGKLVMKRVPENPDQYDSLSTAIYKEMTGWSDMTAVLACTWGYYGLGQDNTLYELYANKGNAELEDFQNLRYAQVVEDDEKIRGIVGQDQSGKILYYGTWDSLNTLLKKVKGEIRQIIGDGSTIFCLLEDGTCISSKSGFPTKKIEKIAMGSDYFVFLMQDGTVAVYPEYEDDWDSNYIPFDAVKDWKNMQDIFSFNSMVYGVMAGSGNGSGVGSSSGSGSSSGAESSYGAGSGSSKVLCVLSDKGGLTEATGCTKLVYDKGTLIGLGGDKKPKMISYSGDDSTGKYQVEGWTDIVDIAFGETHTVGLRADGSVVAVGSNHCGQCDVEEWKNVIKIDATENCTIGVTGDGQLLVTGSVY